MLDTYNSVSPGQRAAGHDLLVTTFVTLGSVPVCYKDPVEHVRNDCRYGPLGHHTRPQEGLFVLQGVWLWC